MPFRGRALEDALVVAFLLVAVVDEVCATASRVCFPLGGDAVRALGFAVVLAGVVDVEDECGAAVRESSIDEV